MDEEEIWDNWHVVLQNNADNDVDEHVRNGKFYGI